MNAQYTRHADGRESFGVEWTHVYGKGTGYTWNPVSGCRDHKCQWEMPNGQVAQCYAKTIADRFRSEKVFPNGFEHHYWNPDRLGDPLRLKKPAGIFLDSMSDLMGQWVPEEQINSVLYACERADWHTFLLLTKNPRRLPKFKFPRNVWVGISVPPTFMYGKRLSQAQQYRWLAAGLEALNQTDARVKWLSAEPLSFDISALVRDAMLDWCVIGAASDGARTYQPDPEHVKAAIGALRESGARIFFKGNMRWPEWYAEFPEITANVR